MNPSLISPGQIEAEHREHAELERNRKMLKGDLVKLSTLLSKNGQLSQTLEKENTLMETDFFHRLKALHNPYVKFDYFMLVNGYHI